MFVLQTVLCTLHFNFWRLSMLVLSCRESHWGINSTLQNLLIMSSTWSTTDTRKPSHRIVTAAERDAETVWFYFTSVLFKLKLSGSFTGITEPFYIDSVNAGRSSNEARILKWTPVSFRMKTELYVTQTDLCCRLLLRIINTHHCTESFVTRLQVNMDPCCPLQASELKNNAVSIQQKFSRQIMKFSFKWGGKTNPILKKGSYCQITMKQWEVLST